MKTFDAYRLFFPLGILLGLGGVAIWPLFYFGILTGYWGISHAFLQSNGFLFCFIAGFLLTAVPRFTQTNPPAILAQTILASVVIAGAIALELQSYSTAQLLFAVAYVILLVVILSRFLKRKSAQLPDTFSLIGIALITGTAGAFVNVLGMWGIAAEWALAGKRSLTEGMTLLLVLGVGGFLGPRLLGFERLMVVEMSGLKSRKRRWLHARNLYFIGGIVVLLTLILEYRLGWMWASFVRAGAASIIFLVTIKPWQLPAVRTTLAWCVWTSVWLTIIALWLIAFFPIYQVDFLHILFIGGFSLLIMAVGMRVTLSHGGHGLAQEKKNWPLRVGLTAGLIAMLARAGAPFSPKAYAMHLELAAILWMIGIGIWGWRLVRLIFQRERPSLP
jgi:uncharacterized protein involved in response to NO